MKDIVVPEYIEKIMRVLRRAGIRAYLVGGCVRDAAMGRTPYDYDITAAAVPSALERALSGTGYSLDLCGARFGTVAAVTGGLRVEITSMRRTIELGICKVNFATELRAAMTAAVRKALEDGTIIDPKKFMGPGREAVKALCIHKIKLRGSDGKA